MKYLFPILTILISSCFYHISSRHKANLYCLDKIGTIDDLKKQSESAILTLGVIINPKTANLCDNKLYFNLTKQPYTEAYYTDQFKRILRFEVLTNTYFSKVEFIDDSLSFITKTYDMNKSRYIDIRIPKDSIASFQVKGIDYLLIFDNLVVSTFNRNQYMMNNYPQRQSVQPPIVREPMNPMDQVARLSTQLSISSKMIVFNCKQASALTMGNMCATFTLEEITSNDYLESTSKYIKSMFYYNPFYLRIK
jgi:hypothetical protein